MKDQNNYFTLNNEQACVIPNTDSQYAVTESGCVYSIRYKRILKQYTNANGYQAINLPIGTKRIHSLVGECFVANPDQKPFIDHIDRNKGNNNYRNLRWVTNEENNKNRGLRSTSKTGYIGVRYKSGSEKYEARISHNKKQLQIGSYSVAEDAARAYDQKAIEYGYAVLNFPDDINK
ncbi:HNH endonuclease [Hymenobacter sublimis]|uniref:HNH endonuclease n=1 Tax=Hymenobacter sublimis TaxID=2933777 RepID=A0ABY4JCK6_9BACT|nr:HNH endonuclease [Hymenobacter sublimis]UPL50545.1 HNH endonuclease [Hymenobacter sublimis]